MQERLMEEFRPLFWSDSAILPALMRTEDSVVESLEAIATRLSRAAVTAQFTLTEVAVTPAGVDTRSPRTSASSHGVDPGSIATTVLESGFGLVPLVAGLVGLFTGGSDAPPPLEKYLMPSAISFASADVGRGLAAVDFDQMGAPRVYGAAVPPAAAPQNAPIAPQVTVNVQAIDAQSFLDYSSQIAQAVRGAMLNMSSLNDVVSEL